jgi:hypothetical protein
MEGEHVHVDPPGEERGEGALNRNGARGPQAEPLRDVPVSFLEGERSPCRGQGGMNAKAGDQEPGQEDVGRDIASRSRQLRTPAPWTRSWRRARGDGGHEPGDAQALGGRVTLMTEGA